MTGRTLACTAALFLVVVAVNLPVFLSVSRGSTEFLIENPMTHGIVVNIAVLLIAVVLGPLVKAVSGGGSMSAYWVLSIVLPIMAIFIDALFGLMSMRS